MWWIPQVPGKAFEVPVRDLRQAAMLCDVLADYDAFQFENNIKPDYCNVGGLLIFDGEDWVDWEDPETFASFDEWRRDSDRSGEADKTHSGLAVGESADPKGIAQPLPTPSNGEPA